MMPRLRSLAGSLLVALLVTAGCRNGSTDTPIAFIPPLPPQGGHGVAVTYTLRNQDTASIFVVVTFSTNGGFTWQQATPGPNGEGTANLAASPGGTTHVFVWDALADLGPGRQDNVILQIAPLLNGQLGNVAVSFLFTVDNTDLFVRQADLAAGRQRPAADPLPDGGVIVAGSGGLIGPTEAFEPGPPLVATHAPLNTLREGDDGTTVLAAISTVAEPQPLVLGGTGVGGVTLGALETYDEGADVWTPSGVSVGARAGHVVTRLLDGRVLVSGGGPAGDVVIDASNPSSPTATAIPLGVNRSGHTATLLPDGRVLVVGGSRSGAALPDSLVFSPATLSYSPGPTLTTARTGHAAAFASPFLLVCGGRDASGLPTSSAETSDPTLAAFTRLAAPMTRARSEHTATSLADGSVLIAGGNDGSGHATALAEHFLPGTLAFVATRAPLEVARAGHRATPFGAGRVLISGGGTPALEVYYPASQVGSQLFDAIASNSSGRADHQVTPLSDGRALVTGGTNGVVVAGRLAALNTAEIIDPRAIASQRMTPVAATMTAARRRHTATLLGDGTVLIAGGIDSTGTPLASLEIFSPQTLTFSPIPETLPQGLFDHTATLLLDGQTVVIAGGIAGSVPTAAAFAFNPAATPRLVALPSGLLVPRARHTAVRLPGIGPNQLLVAGGLSSGGIATASAEVLVSRQSSTPCGQSGLPPCTNFTFAATANGLGVARFDAASAALDDGSVLVAGGRGGAIGQTTTPTADVELLNTASLSFSPLVPMLLPRADFVAAPLPFGRVVFAGGVVAPPAAGAPDEAAPITANAEAYVPSAQTSTATVPLSAARRGARIAPLGDGTTAVIGGRRESGVTVPAGERLFP